MLTKPVCLTTAPDQGAIVDFLSSSHVHGGLDVARIDTHMSHIFLAGGFAYKLKRALKRDFVDYSTIKKRWAACEREFDLNALRAPELYLGVAPIVRRKGALSLGGPGEVEDWVVKMRRYPEGMRLDRLVVSGDVARGEVTAFVDAIVADHHRTAPAADYGGAIGVRRVADRLALTLCRALQTKQQRQAVAVWRRFVWTEIERKAPLIEARRRAGFVRLCHGDLSLRSICRWNGALTPTGAVEFNDELAHVDVGYDISGFVMDLKAHGRDDLGRAALYRYIDQARDFSSAELWPLIMR